LRRAVALALDRPALAAALPGGRWRPTASPIGDDPPAPPPAMPGADPAAAGRLLTGAGWVAGPDGVRRRGDQPLALTLLFPGDDPAAGPIADGLRAQLAAAGVTLRAEGRPAAALLAPDGPARAGRFDLLLVTLPHGPEPLPMLRAAFGCYPPTPIARAGPGPSNYGRWCNPDAARWLDLAAGAPDDAARADAERGLLGVVAAEAPVIPLVVRPGLLAYRAGLHGLAPGRWTPATWNAAVWWRER